MSLADDIRQFVHRTYVRPALQAGHKSVRVRAGDVHKDMELQNRMPAVCGALGSKIFESQSGLQLLRRSGPRQGATATFVFRVLGTAPRPAQPGARKNPEPEIPPRKSAPWRPAKKAGTVYLVSCVSKKRAIPAPARNLYVSDWFVKARAFVEASCCPWFILSAQYGLVDPRQTISPYEKTLNTMPVAERREWADRVAAQFAKAEPDAGQIVFLAGQRYREFLADHFRKQGLDVQVPMKGLRIGEQLGWLTEHARHE